MTVTTGTDSTTSDYGWKTHEHPLHIAWISIKIVEKLKLSGAKRVLDLGSGNGALCSTLSRAGFEVVGVEFDRKGVDIARAAYPQIRFYRYGVQDSPAEILAKEQDRKFDAVVSTEVVEHLFSPHLLPLYARAVLKERGYLFLTTPYHGYIKNLALSITNKWDFHHDPLGHGGHIKFWSPKTITRLLQDNGFRVVEFEGLGRLPYVWKTMLITAQREQSSDNRELIHPNIASK